MLAAGLDFEARRLAEFGLPDPGEPGPSETRLRVAEVGVCATDRELSHFRFGVPPAGESRLALGHEALAQVEAIGAKVTGVVPGDWVVPMIRRPCSPCCVACARLRMDLCLTGQYRERGIVALHGYFAPVAIDPASALVRIPEPLLDVAVLLEPLSVVEKAVEAGERSNVLSSRTAVVTGAGPIGLLTVMALLRRGYDVTCISLEPDDHPRARWAKQAGAQYLQASQGVQAGTLLFEASGTDSGLRLAFQAMRPTGVLVLIGATDLDLHFPGVRAVVENWTIAGVVNAGPDHFRLAVEDLSGFDRRLTKSLIERRPFRQWANSITGGLGSAIKIVHPLH